MKKFFKGIALTIVALFCANIVNAQVTASPTDFELSMGQSQIVTFSGNGTSIEGVMLDSESSTNVDYVGIEFLNSSRSSDSFRVRITCIVPPNSYVVVTLLFTVSVYRNGEFYTETMVITIIIVNNSGRQFQGDCGNAPMMMYATKPE